MKACEIRRMNLDDLDAVVAIEAATFPTPWSRHSFEQELTRNVAARYLVAVLDGQVIGYAGAWIILDESHITNIAIAQAFRGNGSNLRAQNLYTSLGFQPVGWRKRYYEDNQEDALLMVCQSLPPVDPEFEEEETVSG